MAEAGERARAHLFVSGRVQMVGFRYTTVAEAQRLGVCGWVRNREDGRVEAVIQGERGAVEALVAWCRRGPPGAFVRDVQVHWDEPFEPDLDGFRAVATV